ncbi:MAG: crotonase/enoyl-CoA hydratase family protein [Acidimicrobiales bacterium]
MSEAANDAVLTEQRGRVLLITLNRPDAMNSINGALSEGLVAAVERLDADDNLTVGVLTGAGRGFCAGMDLKAFAAGENIGPMMAFIKDGAQKPLIAAIEGFALAGGLELALTCDLLVAAEGVKLGIPEVKVGLFAAGGGLQRLPSRVGFGRAMEMAITGEPIRAEEAKALGLVSRVTEKGGAVEGALELAALVAQNAPLAVKASKQLIWAATDKPEAEFWDIQNPLSASVFTSNDAKEGPKAFAEKRAPEWSGT